MRKNGTLTFILGDHLGSTSLVTDSAGTVINETQYKAWGEIRYSSGSEQTKYTYTGQFSYVSDFGLMYYGARWYDNSLGRFAQADTVTPSGIQGLDRYAYTFNNPIRYTDPSGHIPIDCWNDPSYCSNTTTLPTSPFASQNVAVSTPIPTSTSSSQQTTGVLVACGSQGSQNMSAFGPPCVKGTGSPNENIHMSVWGNAPENYVVEPVQYPGASSGSTYNDSKLKQSQDIGFLASNYSSVVLICYSAGVDSCLFVANQLDNLVTIVLIGQVGYGGYANENNLVTVNNGLAPFEQGFQGEIEKLSNKGINVLIIDDSNAVGDSYRPVVANGKFQNTNSSTIDPYLDHTTIDDSPYVQQEIWKWITEPSFYFP